MYYSDGCYTALTKLGFSSQLLSKLSPAAKSHMMNAGIGAAGGAVLGGEDSRMSGALGGAALGLGAGHLMGQAAEGAAAKKGLSSVEQAAEGAATHRPSGEVMRAIEKTKAPTRATDLADPFAGMLPQALPPDGMFAIPKAAPVPTNLGPVVPGTPMLLREPHTLASSQPVPLDSMQPPVSGIRLTNYPDTVPVGNSMLPTMQPVAKTGSVIPPRLFLPLTKMAMDPRLADMLSHSIAARTKRGFVNPNQAINHGLIGAGLGGVAGAIGGGEDHRLAGGLAGAITGGSLGALHGEYKGLPSAAEAKAVAKPVPSLSLPPAASASMPPAMAMPPESPEGGADKLQRLRNTLLGIGFSNP